LVLSVSCYPVPLVNVEPCQVTADSQTKPTDLAAINYDIHCHLVCHYPHMVLLFSNLASGH